MSAWKDLYDIYDKERIRWQKERADKQALSFEIESNLIFLADALENKINQMDVVIGLEHSVFDNAMIDGFNFDSIAPHKVSDQTIGDIDEFKKYIGKDTCYLVKNGYLKITSLIKLVNNEDGKDYSLKIKSLFRFFMLLATHIKGQHLKTSS